VADVKISSVTKKFGDVFAVDNFSALIRDGEFVSILGPSGCGKTTMLRMIAGFERATEGEIAIGDQIVSKASAGIFVPPEKRHIGMVFQSYAVWPHMNVFDNVSYPLKIQKVGAEKLKERTEQALELVHLEEYAARFPNQLSGGQQQRVALARALVAEPALLLLDEPLSNLDAKLRESMRFEIKDLQKKLGITVVYVTHDQAEAMAMSDRIIVMHKGVIQQIDEPIRVYEHPANPTVADFIGLVNFLEGEVNSGVIRLAALDCSLPTSVAFNGSARVAVRPEHIRMSKTEGELKGKLINKFYLGDSTDCRVQVGDTEVRVIEKGAAFAEYVDGEDVYLSFGHMMIFQK
jgi:iron(III) transport system ATP-binding protein